ncbi:MAG: ankyrin repeat domain-containing protein [Bacteroidia bacterium]|nr:ankyrin repeat domain-containing protein [Bacteroidia bacterium]
MLRSIQTYFQKRKVIRMVGSFDQAGLVVAVNETNTKALEILLKNGISPDARTNKGVSALSLAVQKGDMPVIQMLLKARASIDIQDKDGSTPLMKAIESENRPIFTLITDYEPELEIADYQGETALFKAVKQGHTTFCRKLIDLGANVDIANHKGITPLMLAVGQLYTGIVKSLLHAGADPTVKDHSGQTASDHNPGNAHIAQMLKEALARRGIKDKSEPGDALPFSDLILNEKFLSQILQLGSLLVGLAEGLLNSISKKNEENANEDTGVNGGKREIANSRELAKEFYEIVQLLKNEYK